MEWQEIEGIEDPQKIDINVKVKVIHPDTEILEEANVLYAKVYQDGAEKFAVVFQDEYSDWFNFAQFGNHKENINGMNQIRKIINNHFFKLGR